MTLGLSRGESNTPSAPGFYDNTYSVGNFFLFTYMMFSEKVSSLCNQEYYEPPFLSYKMAIKVPTFL